MKQNIGYDKTGDVLYVRFLDSDEPCDYVEIPDGIVLRFGIESGTILGCTIMWFEKNIEAKAKQFFLDNPDYKYVGSECQQYV